MRKPASNHPDYGSQYNVRCHIHEKQAKSDSLFYFLPTASCPYSVILTYPCAV